MDIFIRKAAAFAAALLAVAAFAPSVRAAGQSEPSGDYLVYTADIKKPSGETLAFAFTRLKQLDYVIRPGDTLEYDVCIVSDSPGLGAMDGEIEGLGRSMRDNGFADQNGLGIHPGMDLRGSALGKWWRRSISIALDEGDTDASHVTAGKKLEEIQLAVHPDSADYSQLEAVVYYDNIVITNGGEEVLVIFRDASDFDPSAVSTNNKKNVTGASIAVNTLSTEEQAALERERQSELEAASQAEQDKLNKKLEGKAAREQAALRSGDAPSTEALTDDNSDTAATSGEDALPKKALSATFIIIAAAAAAIAAAGVAIFFGGRNRQSRNS